MLDLSLARAPLSTRDERALRETLAADLGDEALARRLVQAGITRAADYRELLEGLPQGAEEERARSLDLVGSLGQSVRNLKSCGDRSRRPRQQPARLFPAGQLALRPGRRARGPRRHPAPAQPQAARDRGRRPFNEVPAIPGFPGELNQVWTNLISNAAQAMGGRGWLGLSTDARPDGGVAVAMADNGPGIAPKHQERIFEARFTTREGRVEFGLGLGLPICKNIVARHGGSITVESRPGRTVFTVTLPASPHPSRIRKAAMNRIVILCVEDKPRCATPSSAISPRSPPRSASKSRATPRMRATCCPLREIVRPGRPRHLRPPPARPARRRFLVDITGKPEFRRTRKVLLTGQAGHQDTVRAINEARLNHYISKPWKAEYLRQVVREQLTEYVIQTQDDFTPYLRSLDAGKLNEAMRERGMED